jgi:hypothetical protein
MLTAERLSRKLRGRARVQPPNHEGHEGSRRKIKDLRLRESSWHPWFVGVLAEYVMRLISSVHNRLRFNLHQNFGRDQRAYLHH